jgi:hypothetical protein
MGGAALPFGRVYSLDNREGSTGISCDKNGLKIGPVALLRRTWLGFEPRPLGELEYVLSKAYGGPVKLGRHLPALVAIAKALNEGDVATAIIATLHMNLSVLDTKQASRAALAERLVKNYDPNEARDQYGRWTTEEGGGRVIPAAHPTGGEHEGNNERGGRGLKDNPNIRIDPSLTVTEVPVETAIGQEPRGQRHGQSVHAFDHQVYGVGTNIRTGYIGFFAPSGSVGLVTGGRGYIVSSTQGYQLNVTTSENQVTTIEPFRGY